MKNAASRVRRSSDRPAPLVESLEPRKLMSAGAFPGAPVHPGRAALTPIAPGAAPLSVVTASLNTAAAEPTVTASEQPATERAIAAEGNLTVAQVRQLLAQAASVARPGQAIAVVDREGVVLGVFAMTGAPQSVIDAAIVRARTGAYFQSRQNAFTTRTARFIIQDRFPFPIKNTAGGPLYGVQFSSLPGTDMLPSTGTPAISGDPGGMPLFVNRVPVGGIGVAGDGNDVAPRFDLNSNLPGDRNNGFYRGKEESDFDESVAIAGSSGGYAPANVRLNASAPKSIIATNVFLPGPALRFPYTVSKPAPRQPFQTVDQLIAAGRGNLVGTVVASQPNPFPKVAASVYGLPGELKNTSTLSNAPNFGIIPSNDGTADALTVAEDRKSVV